MMKENQQQEESNKLDVKPIVGKFLISYDMAAKPQGLSVDLLSKLVDTGWLYYDSTKGNRPQVYAKGDEVFSVKFVDTKGNDYDFNEVKLQWEDEEFWRKELYMCRQSPLHYFENYYAKTPKPTQKEISEYLESINLGAVSDSDEVTKEKMVKAREAFAKSIELDELKKLKPVRDLILKEYLEETDKLEEEAFKALGVVVLEDDKDADMAKRRLKEKVIASIMKSDKKTAPPELKSYLHQGRWDKKALRLTERDALLRLWKQIR